MDGHFHQDIRPTDVVAWPTNIGWMMGPWLIYATLINRGCIALYEGVPTGRGFAEFVAKEWGDKSDLGSGSVFNELFFLHLLPEIGSLTRKPF